MRSTFFRMMALCKDLSCGVNIVFVSGILKSLGFRDTQWSSESPCSSRCSGTQLTGSASKHISIIESTSEMGQDTGLFMHKSSSADKIFGSTCLTLDFGVVQSSIIRCVCISTKCKHQQNSGGTWNIQFADAGTWCPNAQVEHEQSSMARI